MWKLTCLFALAVSVFADDPPYRYEEFTLDGNGRNYVIVMNRKVNQANADQYCSDHHDGALASVPDVATREALSRHLKRIQDNTNDYRFNEIATAEKTNNKEHEPVNEADELDSAGQHCAVLQAWDPVKKNFLGDTYSLQSKPCDRPRTFLCEVKVKLESVKETSCTDFKDQRGGLYNIRVGDRVITVYCHRGRTVIQRRVNASLSFDRTFTEYEDGFGGPYPDNYWIGLKALAELTKTPHELEVVVKTDSDPNSPQLFGFFGKFQVGPGDSYKLTVGDARPWTVPPTPGLGGIPNLEALTFHSGANFYTSDKDTPKRCAKRHEGGWWFRDSEHGSTFCTKVVLLSRYTYLYWTGLGFLAETTLLIRPRTIY